MTRFFLRSSTAALLVLLVASCGSQVDPTAGVIDCSDEELYDQTTDECVPRYRDTDPADQVVVADPVVDPDPDPVVDPDPVIDTERCDVDGDGVLSEECGGNDCDDNARERSPMNIEVCDHVDNDCTGFVNDGIRCTFYAHSGRELYQVDPFKLEATQVGDSLPNLQDIDTHPNGTLFGVSFDGLYEFDEFRSQWIYVGDFGMDVGDPNGMAIDLLGNAFITSQDKVYTVDLFDGRASMVGPMDGDFYSSGDCVVNKGDTLFMTSKHDQAEDHLVMIDQETGRATEIGPVGFSRIYALTSAWGQLYGLTRDGELISIDRDGSGTLIHQFQGTVFYGAASTPDR